MAIYSEELIEYLHNGNIERAIKYADAYSVLLRYLSISYSDRKDNVYLLDEKLKSANISPDINRWFTDHIEVTYNGDYVNIRLRALLYGASISKDGLMTVRMIALKKRWTTNIIIFILRLIVVSDYASWIKKYDEKTHSVLTKAEKLTIGSATRKIRI